MGIGDAIVVGAGLSLMLGSAAEGLPTRAVRVIGNPPVITFQSPEARVCLRRRLNLLTRFNDNSKRRLKLGCPGLLTLPIRGEGHPPPPPPPPITQLDLTKDEAACLRDFLLKFPNAARLVLADCPVGGRRR